MKQYFWHAPLTDITSKKNQKPIRDENTNLLSQARILYRSTLHRFKLARLFKRCALCVYYTFPKHLTTLYLLARTKKHSFIAMSFSDYAAAQGVPRIGLLARSCRKQVRTTFISSGGSVRAESYELVQPEVAMHTLSNVRTMCGTNLIFDDRKLAYPDYHNISEDLLTPELFGMAKQTTETKIHLRITRSPLRIKSAISLLGQCNGNYAHFLTETLPKVVLSRKLEANTAIPFIIDGWIHPKLLSFLDLLRDDQRPIVKMARWETIEVERLTEISPISYTAAAPRVRAARARLPDTNPAKYVFSGPALQELRAAALQRVGTESSTTRKRRLFVRRPPESCGNGRLLANEFEIAELAAELGYTIIDPAKMSIQEQIRCFSQATHVTGAIGAALANVIFAPSGCNVTILSPHYSGADYYYFSNLMGVLDHSLTYVLAPYLPTTEPWKVANNDFSIDAQSFRSAIESLETTGH